MSEPSGNFSQNFGSEEHRFKELSEKYVSILKTVGIQRAPYKAPELPFFSRLPIDKKLQATVFLENALEVFEESRAAGENLRNNRTLIWRMLNQLKLIPDSEIFDKIGDEDVVEIYSLPEHFHLAWNVHLMAYVSFSAEELLCQPWWELCSRPMEAMQELQRLSAAVIANEITTTFVPNIPRHLIREHGSQESLTIEVEIKYISPLRQNGRNAAVLVTNKSRLVEP